jgi:hypothetical protein
MAATNQEVLNYLSSPNLSDADIYAFMQQKGVPASQISSVTGVPLADIVSRVTAVAPTNTLGGTILAGDSWLAGADKTALANQAFGENVTNVAVGGFKTDDALNQLNSFLNNGGVFKTGSTVVLDIGGNDLLQGVSRDTVKSNLNEILSVLDREGVKVVLSGAPAVGSVSDVTSSTALKMDSLYKEVAQPYKNVTVVDAMSGLLNNKTVVDASGFHVNTAGQTDFLNQLASATDKKETPPEVVAQITQPQKDLALTTENINKLASQILAQNTTSKWSGGLSPETSALYMASDLAKSGVTDISQVGQGTDGIINKVTGEKLVSGYAERTKGNLWSGSYSGKGNTGFGVDFDESGKPLFYTTGASSSDVPSWVKPALILGAAYLGLDAAGLLSVGEAAPVLTTAGTIAGTVGTTGMTMAELAQLDLALGGAGGTLGAETLAAALTSGALVPTLANLTGGSGLLTSAPITAESVAAKLASDSLLSPTTIVPPITTPTTTVPPTGVPPVIPPVIPPTGTPTVIPPLAKALIPTAISGLLTPSNTGNLITAGATTAAGLLQQQTSKEAALAAQQRIDAETAAAKQSAAFRPIGMTTRFGTSQFAVDPVTGQLTSAGYTLSPEAKAQQDRFVALSNQGLTQAEAAQAQYAPLQTGAQSLFNLGNQYLAKSPQDVAQNYLNQQMALLQPGRELELATLQNKLQQQGRGGLSVAQGGTYGATTPELQALYNARAQQEALLAANAQKSGQADVLFGAGLLGQGSTAMGNYYAGQQAAYAPYTTAMTQAKDLETLAQKPFTMATDLAQQTSAAGARMGQLGLQGAQQSVALATGNAATTNPYSTALSGLASNPAFSQYLNGLFKTAPTSGFSNGQYGAGVDPTTGEYFGSLYF